jgi:hypothetical protein
MPKKRVQRSKTSNAGPAARVVFIPNAVDEDGEPRVALEVPPRPGSVSRRPALLLFASMAAALASKRMLEGTR